MTTLSKKIILTTFAFTISIFAFSQNGWVKQKGEVFASLGLQTFSSDRFFELNGDELKTNAFQQTSLDLYAEYGIFKKLTAIVTFPLQRWQSYTVSEVASGIGDAKIEFKVPLYQKGVYVAASIAPELPLAKGDQLTANKELPGVFINLPTGDGEFNVWNTLAVSTSGGANNLSYWTSGFGSYNVRTKYKDSEFSDQFKFGADFGVKLKNKLSLQANLIMQKKVGNKMLATDFIRGEGNEFTIYSLSLSYEVIKNWSIYTRYSNFLNGPIAQKNLYSGSIFNFGVYFSHQRK